MFRNGVLLAGAIAGVAAILAIGMSARGSQAPTSLTREVVLPPGSTPGTLPFSPGIKVGNIVYVSGQIGGEAGPGVREQMQVVLKKVQAIAEAAGSSVAKIDKCTVFLTRQEDFQAMNEVWRTFFPTNPPARSTIIAAALARPAFVVEIECVAHI